MIYIVVIVTIVIFAIIIITEKIKFADTAY
jgi:hypothetical protein